MNLVKMNAKKDQDVALKKYEKVEDMINQITVEMKGLNRGRNVAFNISEKVVKIGKKIGSGSFGYCRNWLVFMYIKKQINFTFQASLQMHF